MTAKEYLGQAYRIDQRINSKLEQITSLRELAFKATSTLSETPRGPSRDAHSMESIIVKMMNLEDEINRDIDMLVDLKREIVSIIKQVQNPEYQTLLELRYLCFKRWEQIAVDMGYSTQHIFRMMDLALKAAEAPMDTVRIYARDGEARQESGE
jgi:hypothetical protein